ncbi:MAG TPA: hypothetical protein VF476_05910 [Chitinophagaceae bacterium]
MFAKVKSSVFIDALQFELTAPKGNCVKGVLKDDAGSICSTLEKNMTADGEKFTWSGLNHLPYGRYTLELSHGTEESDNNRLKMDLVKRV